MEQQVEKVRRSRMIAVARHKVQFGEPPNTGSKLVDSVVLMLRALEDQDDAPTMREIADACNCTTTTLSILRNNPTSIPRADLAERLYEFLAKKPLFV